MADNTDRKAEQAEQKADRKADQAERKAQQAVDKETKQGFRGEEVDGTPNEAYTVQGQLAGADVPEAAADPVAARRDASNL